MRSQFRSRSIDVKKGVAKDTEKEFILPEETMGYFVQSRNQNKLKIAFESGDIANGDYITVFPNGWENSIPFYSSKGRTDSVFVAHAGDVQDPDDIEFLDIT